MRINSVPEGSQGTHWSFLRAFLEREEKKVREGIESCGAMAREATRHVLGGTPEEFAAGFVNRMREIEYNTARARFENIQRFREGVRG